jgi:hypothetical protein
VRAEPVLDRLWRKVTKTDTCWLWTGAVNQDGYGQIRSSGKLVTVHRLSYETHVGPIPKGFEVDHTCLVRNCVNPAHFRLATRPQNNQHRAPRKDGTGYRGVSRKGQRWTARVQVDRRQVYLGTFDTIEEAAAAASEGRKQLMPYAIEEAS